MPDMQPGAPARGHPCPSKWELCLRYALPSAVVAPPLQTISRALDVLLSFSESRTDWGVLELAEHTGWSKSSAQRVLAALAAQGFLWADPSTRRYGLGPAIWRLSSLWERTGGVARIADDCLRGLTADTGLSASFSARDGIAATPLARASRGDRNRTSGPSTSTAPDDGAVLPLMMPTSVDFPAPFSPIRAVHEPARRSSETSRRTSTAP